MTFEAGLLALYDRCFSVVTIDSYGFTKTTNAHGIIHALILLLTSEAFDALALKKQQLLSDEKCTVSGNAICFHQVHMSRFNA